MAAQNDLGVAYYQGQGVAQDYVEAVQWFRMAAEQGHADAQYNLSVAYRDGQGVAQDYVEAVRWFRMAAEQGFVLAQSNLGVMYADGRGVPQDYVQAYKWAYIAEKAHPGEYHHEIRPGIVASRMTPEQLAEAQRLVRERTLTTE